jgi:uncharacterized DUF497 family protein
LYAGVRGWRLRSCCIGWLGRGILYIIIIMEFRWNAWNVDHIAQHGVSPEEAEYVVRHARRPYPRKLAAKKYIVRGQTQTGAHIQVIYIFDPGEVRFVIHSRPLNEIEKHRFRRERRP